MRYGCTMYAIKYTTYTMHCGSTSRLTFASFAIHSYLTHRCNKAGSCFVTWMTHAPLINTRQLVLKIWCIRNARRLAECHATKLIFLKIRIKTANESFWMTETNTIHFAWHPHGLLLGSFRCQQRNYDVNLLWMHNN